jgi:hypothetical protein
MMAAHASLPSWGTTRQTWFSNKAKQETIKCVARPAPFYRVGQEVDKEQHTHECNIKVRRARKGCFNAGYEESDDLSNQS